MAYEQEIAWGDGSGDKIYITGNASEGNQTISVSSDANTGFYSRTKTVTFSAPSSSPTLTATLTVTQKEANDLVVPVYNSIFPSYNDVSRGFIRRSLPSGYSAVEYVSFNGQTLVTGEKTKNTSVIEAKIYINSSTNTYFWQSDSNSSGTSNTTAYYSSAGNWRFDGKTTTIANTLIKGNIHEFKQDSSGILIDGEIVGTYSNVSTFTSSANLKFGSSASTTVRFYYFRHTRDGILVSDYVPCVRTSDSAAGFYDFVTDTFTSIGTAGPLL